MAAPDEVGQGGFADTVELVRRAQAGDGSAMEGVLARYYPRVRQIVRERLGRRLRRYAESADLVQETLGEAVGAFDRFDMQDEQALTRWLARLVENRIRALARRHGAQKRDVGLVLPLAGGSAESGAADPVASALSPLDELGRDEVRERVREGLARLEERHRRVMELRGAGESWARVAAALALPSEGAARMLHARARVALLRVLAADHVSDADLT